ncbi:MAG: AAA family ATPase [Patulibacter minatonensis]
MRIHHLTIDGIGPYATRQEIDVDRLSSGGLFLLTGPTGAGKTTILDAIVYALYGSVPGVRGARGERATSERIVSDPQNPRLSA